MLKEQIKKRERYFIITGESIINEYFDLETAKKSTGNIVIVIDKYIGETYHRLANDNYRLSEFEYLNEIDRKNNDWTIEKVQSVYKTQSYVDYQVTISDPCKIIRIISQKIDKKSNIADPNDHDIIGAIIGRKLLFDYSQYQSWKHIDAIMENERLRAEVEKLKMKLKGH